MGREQGGREGNREGGKKQRKKKKTKEVSNPTIISQMKKQPTREGKILALGHMCTESLHQNQPQRLLQLFLATHKCELLCLLLL